MAASPAEPITPEEVRRNNSNLFQYDRQLASEMQKCRFRPSQPVKYNAYCEASGLTGYVNPYSDIDLRLDLEVFMSECEPVEVQLLQGLLEGHTQQAIAARIGRSQTWVCMRLQRMRERFAAYYLGEDLNDES